MITTADGSPLVDSIIEDDGTHDTLVLGGRMHVDGVAHAAPTVTGDPTALAELDALQLGDLEPLLVGSGIADNLQFTKANVGARANATNCGSWMYTNQTVTCGSVFFGYTSMLLENFDYYPMMANFNGTATMLGGLGYGSSSGPWYQDHGGWWWGAYVSATNWGYCPAGWCASVNFWDSSAVMQFTH